MGEETNTIEEKIGAIERAMSAPDFWLDKNRAQEILKEYQNLKDAKEGIGSYDRSNAILSIYAGAGGDDAEDFARMLMHMYRRYVEGRGWNIHTLYENRNDHGGYRNISCEISSGSRTDGVYGTLRGEHGVHRLVRISPFNANGKRQTSFVLVEVLPLIEHASIDIPESDFEFIFQRSSGPGGQNVNKRETAVRAIHRLTGISAHVDGERTQHANKEKAVAIVTAKLIRRMEEEHKEKVAELSPDPGKIEWGSQIRSYVLHPYKMVKDHRTNVEVGNAEKVLEEGDIQKFIDAEQAI